jgi:hypothetical protein
MSFIAEGDIENILGPQRTHRRIMDREHLINRAYLYRRRRLLCYNERE